MISTLSDLDELILRCRDQKAKEHIREAVACYKAGAFRAAIVLTWIAVSFDIIEKLKELSLAGDKEADKCIGEFEEARRKGDISQSLSFEKKILTVCKDKLEFISPIEFIDLNRLLEDRNRCAHPSMTIDGNALNPPAELARLHIRTAVEHLLQHPPAQGKYALETLVSEVKSEYFPTDDKKALIAFRHGPLNRARDSLVRNFTIILIKMIIHQDLEYKEFMRISAALKSIGKLHRERYIEILKSDLSRIIRNLKSEELGKPLKLISIINDCWTHLEDDIKQKIELYLEILPKENIGFIENLWDIPELIPSLNKRINKMSREEMEHVIFFSISKVAADKVVEIYGDSNSFSQANSFSNTVRMYATDFSKEQIERIISACGENEQIKYSKTLDSVVKSLMNNKNISEDEFNTWLHEADLNDLIEDKSQDLQ